MSLWSSCAFGAASNNSKPTILHHRPPQFYNVPFNNTNALLVTKPFAPAPAPSTVQSNSESPGIVVAIAVPVAVVGTLGIVGAVLVGYMMYRRKHPKPKVPF